MNMVRHIWALRRTVLFAALMAIIFTDSITEFTYSLYDDYFPVIRYEGKEIARTPDDVTVSVAGEKLRDCAFIDGSLSSYYIKSGILFTADQVKISGLISSRPVGPVYLGIWRVFPVPPEAEKLMMFVRHSCGKHDHHIVLSEFVNMALKP